MAFGVNPLTGLPGLPCTDCGHVWGPGERRHEHDHHRGYEAEHHQDVEVVCTLCHRARCSARGELVQVRNSRGLFTSKEQGHG